MDELYTFAVLLVLTGLLLWSWEFTGKLRPPLPPETTTYVPPLRRRSWEREPKPESNSLNQYASRLLSSPDFTRVLKWCFRLGLVLLYLFAMMLLLKR